MRIDCIYHRINRLKMKVSELEGPWRSRCNGFLSIIRFPLVENQTVYQNKVLFLVGLKFNSLKIFFFFVFIGLHPQHMEVPSSVNVMDDIKVQRRISLPCLFHHPSVSSPPCPSTSFSRTKRTFQASSVGLFSSNTLLKPLSALTSARAQFPR